ncbi:hypothetical protein SAMN04488109_4714 [Chryseolinea serpens]|uniref:Outer membrane protein beta-barrel domain-containing protein n=1 Tax=Chryseolinea serpens TaxID=947013 RepID=A0A1M5UI95_9BACT|nr:hypothetical protein [Chryseolinea serpens]SHH62735.1 hypothetical protein SAMN04488109_4714 [Chryseolinea serpens]
MRILFVIVLSCSFLHAFSQIEYEKGYFINNDGVRTDCLIKNSDWFGSPDKIRYKNSESSDPVSLSVSEIKELGVGNARFIRTTLMAELATRDIRKISVNKNPEWKEQTLFLRVLVEGKANLYHHRTKGFDYFFFSIDNGDIKQLVYKLYLLTYEEMRSNVYYNTNTNYGENREYINQLQTYVYCASFSIEKVKQVKYERKPLAKYFTDYNTCHGIVAVDREKHSKQKVHLKIAPGIGTGSQTRTGTVTHIDYGKGTDYRLGAELEFVLPFNRNKWSIFLEPGYHSFKTTGKNAVTYQSIETTIGARYYFFLGKNTSLFLNAGIVGDLALTYQARDFNASGVSISFAGGGGFQYKKFSLEARQYGTRRLLTDGSDTWLNFQKLSFILGYKIF